MGFVTDHSIDDATPILKTHFTRILLIILLPFYLLSTDDSTSVRNNQ